MLIVKRIQNTQELTSNRLWGFKIISLQMKQKYIGFMVESAHSEPLISVCQLPFLFILPRLLPNPEINKGDVATLCRETCASPAPVKQMHSRLESNCRQV